MYVCIFYLCAVFLPFSLPHFHVFLSAEHLPTVFSLCPNCCVSKFWHTSCSWGCWTVQCGLFPPLPPYDLYFFNAWSLSGLLSFSEGKQQHKSPTDCLCLTPEDSLFNLLKWLTPEMISTFWISPKDAQGQAQVRNMNYCQEQSSWQCSEDLSASGNESKEPNRPPSSYLDELFALNCWFSSSCNLIVHCHNKQFWLLYSKGLHRNLP